MSELAVVNSDLEFRVVKALEDIAETLRRIERDKL